MLGVAKFRVGTFLIGIALLLQLSILRIVAWADSDHVWLFGRELHWDCWFKQQFAVPCPTCGMTRSVILTLYGHPEQALNLNAAGPLFVAGLLVLAATMFYQAVQTNGQQDSRRLALGMVAYGWIFGSVLMGQWTIKLLV